ncbi:hypothetical protein [Desulfobacula phenolica]|uniref:Uncharacterized protein n=1 Tax=Desulfobacula phenolica TaxID=90732 RepID=A0A1H2DMX5_9BACT|nr:hypothetical protein [Desulfobacula phenolica]SDT84273.1 hypothetical protein SAMN04487931_101185 [Desulfobacula phenolica]
MKDKKQETRNFILKLSNSRHAGLVWLVMAGIVAGCGFNIAFGTFALDMQGIMGGAISGILIHSMS